jgi:polyhydroxyalkanoate synthesis repressor PhaR
MSELRRLKKYPNRRLYDFERHCYVCLDDVRALIAAKQDVQVIENETSNDITRETMMQVVMLLEETGHPLFSNAFLTQLIQCRALDTAGQLGRYLDDCMKAFAEKSEGLHDDLPDHPQAESNALDIPLSAPRA